MNVVITLTPVFLHVVIVLRWIVLMQVECISDMFLPGVILFTDTDMRIGVMAFVVFFIGGVIGLAILTLLLVPASVVWGL
jgi:hypothetical protein